MVVVVSILSPCKTDAAQSPTVDLQATIPVPARTAIHRTTAEAATTVASDQTTTRAATAVRPGRGMAIACSPTQPFPATAAPIHSTTIISRKTQ